MSAPISHIAFAEIILQRLPQELKTCDFYTGVCFPDIRYLGGIDKEKTHPHMSSFNDISDDSAFLAGVKCHAYLDQLRDRYLENSDVYESLTDLKLSKMGLKFVEDQLRAKSPLRKDVAHCLDSLLAEELRFGLSENKILHWHRLLKDYLCSSVNDYDVECFLQNLTISSDKRGKILDTLALTSQNRHIIDTFNNFYDQFDEMIDKEIENSTDPTQN